LLKVGALEIKAAAVLQLASAYLTPERQARIQAVVSERTYSILPVLENIYDRGNVSAVLRSAEGMGYQSVHVIESGEKFKKANRVTQGADKWLDVTRWSSTTDCIQSLKRAGYRIYATHFQEATPIEDIDWTQPSAIVFGNEKDGVSQEMLAQVDGRVVIPMRGFVQSFNISVAAAVALHYISLQRRQKLGHHGDLNDEQKLILSALYCLRSTKNPERFLRRLLAR